MDRPDINNNNSLQVTAEEIFAELNQQIMALNFELTVNKIAVKKLQEELAKYVSLSE
jgi:hypothetical protein